MRPFAFQTTPSIVFGAGESRRLAEPFAARGCRRVALVTDEGCLGLGLTDRAQAGFEEAGIELSVWSDVGADPPEDKVLAAVEAAREAGVDGIAALGGGSPMDTAKLVAVLVGHAQELPSIYGVGNVEGARLPLALCPTTAGTGSEVTPIAIVTTGDAEKKGVVAPQLLPDAAVLDPELTLGLPAAVTAATGIDAMVHAIEAYTSKHRKNPLSDALARQALELLAGNIRTVCETPGDVDARGAMLLGSMLAGQAFANAPVAAVHALAYPLGGHFHVPHGLSNAMVLPGVLAFNAEAAAPLYAELAPILFPDLAGAAPQARVDGLIERVRALAPELGLDISLKSAGVSHNHLPMLAEDAMKQERLLVNNPREMTYDAALAIYEAAL